MFIESMHFADGDADVLFEAVVLLHIAEALAWLALCVVHGLAAFAGGLAFFALQAALAGLAGGAPAAGGGRGGGGATKFISGFEKHRSRVKPRASCARDTPAARNPPAPTYTRYDASHMNSAAAAAGGGGRRKKGPAREEGRGG